MTDNQRDPDDIVARLLEEILTAQVRAGQHLKLDELAEDYGVSRTPVREALRELTTMGVVEYRSRHGFYVSERDAAARFDEVVAVRRLLEPPMHALAAVAATEEQIAEMRSLVERGRAATRDGATGVATWAHHRLLISVCEASSHREFQRALTPLYYRSAVAFSGNLAHAHEHGWDAHAAIVDALAARDGDLAARLVREHLDTIPAAR